MPPRRRAEIERRNRDTAELLWSVVVIIYAGLLLVVQLARGLAP